MIKIHFQHQHGQWRQAGIISGVLMIAAFSLAIISCNKQEQDPEAAHEQLELGFAQADHHDWAAALKHFDHAVKLDSTNALAWANHGTALLNLGRPEEAIRSYLHAKRLNPKDPYIYCSLSSASIRLDEPNEAIQFAEGALAVDSTYTSAMANKARALKLLGRTNEADALFQKALALNATLRQHFTCEGEKP